MGRQIPVPLGPFAQRSQHGTKTRWGDAKSRSGNSKSHAEGRPHCRHVATEKAKKAEEYAIAKKLDAWEYAQMQLRGAGEIGVH